MARKKLTDAQKQFIAGDDLDNQSSQQANTEVNTQISDDIGQNLKQELFGDRKAKEFLF